jgi:trans-AT polyketide synthase/acyltransferase/oxidoreductase domain-containing protein
MKKAIMFAGQGSQYKGMGKELFAKYKTETQLASDILQYDLEALCVQDPDRNLIKTQFTQPALYVVNYFRYKELNQTPDFLLGHSLGEYNAILSAGGFDFETGLKIVQKRGALMAAASGGSMAAVVGLKIDELEKLMNDSKYDDLDIANFNTPVQTVISGPKESINGIVKDFSAQDIRIIPLQVSAPFHSRYMKSAEIEFSEFLKECSFHPLEIPVISNVTARPYQDHEVAELLGKQISSSVQWVDSIRYLMGQNVTEFIEEGRPVVSKMAATIQTQCSPIQEEILPKKIESISDFKSNGQSHANGSIQLTKNNIAYKLGSETFRKEYGVDFSYVAGAMYKGIASKELVIRMAKAKMLSFLGTGGLTLQEISDNIDAIQKELSPNAPYGMNLLYNIEDPTFELDTVKLYIQKGVRNIEASAYMQITEPLAYFHVSGLTKSENGDIINRHKILAKLSRPEVAEGFMRPVSERLLTRLLDQQLITNDQAELARKVPISYDICIEADSGGHTDRGVASVLFPSIERLKRDIEKEYGYTKNIRMGLAGGIGTPMSAASAFVMGADFVLTGSINQCTVEANMSNEVKDLLQTMNVQDTGYAPSGNTFELGSKVQVLKKGVLFPVRANKLYNLYSQYASLDEIPERTRLQLEKNYFKKSISEIWEETKSYFEKRGRHDEIEKAEKRPKHKMALIFRWYFSFSNRIALQGDVTHKVDFQVHTGPALGAFNQWVKGTDLESWKNRHVDQIGIKLMDSAGVLLTKALDEIHQQV